MGRRSRLRQQAFRQTPELDRLHGRENNEWEWHGDTQEAPAADGPNEWLWDQK